MLYQKAMDSILQDKLGHYHAAETRHHRARAIYTTQQSQLHHKT